ncbi:family 20 glycosylhydrolase [Microbulbifer bruguierae]|uniref:beta-N-acetylhexosaminidase n=1 Tax=Microbulbifer bruguierae TaxID=3029061 RepID=A0ABY8NC59_9GAMM|nr:family 20 glycosylhydrolase [Microbulbifer bruguierae]WGL16508.1 family 20 glycosylhydrolase [Microbulbifer bruguierae]
MIINKAKFIFSLLILVGTSKLCLATDYETLAADAKIRFGVVSNFSESGKFRSFLEIENGSDVSIPKGKSDWSIYFHFVRTITDVESDEVDLENIQGDLYRLTPRENFSGVDRGDKYRVFYQSVGHIASYAYFMPNVFIVGESGNPFVFKNTATEEYSQYTYPIEKPEQYLRFDQDQYHLVTPERRYEAAYNAELDPNVISIIPTPREMYTSRGQIDLTGEWSIRQAGGLQFESEYLQKQLNFSGVTVEITDSKEAEKTISLVVSDTVTDSESYELDIKSDRITIVGGSRAGVFYGVQSLLSLVPAENPQGLVKIPAVRVFDAPRYKWRGMHYDIARNFHGKSAILRLIEQMGRYKLNRLHLHLTDDEGWRIEIPGLPELTDIGASRCFDLSEQHCLLTQLGTGPYGGNSGSGSLSREDYIEILRFAKNRNIQVIPEIDMPGHARAATVAMNARYQRFLSKGDKRGAEEYLLSDPQDRSEYTSVQNYTDNAINVCMDSTYRFVNKVVYEIQRMHRDAGAALDILHMGGDEVGKGAWAKSPVCQQLFDKRDSQVVGVDDLKAYFVSKVSAIADRRGISIMGWEDGLMYDKNTPFPKSLISGDRVIANAWDNIWEYGVSDRAYILANAGYDVVLSSATHLYFDHPYETNPHNRGYHWATRYTDIEKVFSFMPDDLYANADRTLGGRNVENLDDLANKVHEKLIAPERILGIQGQLWTETIRTEHQVEEMIFPRLIALAERAWHEAAWESKGPKGESYAGDWSSFLSSLVVKDLPKLDQRDVHFYVPPPGLKLFGNRVFPKSVIPGLKIEFSLDEGETWQMYSEQFVEPTKQLRFRARLGGQVSRPVGMTL